MTAKMPLKFGQIAEFFYDFLFKMGLIGAYPLWKIIDAVTLTSVTMGTYIAVGLAENNIRQANQHHSAQEAPTLQRILTPLVSRALADGLGCWDPFRSLGTAFLLPLGINGRKACAAQILGSFKGFSQPLRGQSAVKSEVVVNEVEALCE